MWLFDRRGFLAMGAGALLVGCGYTPAFAPNAASSKLQNNIFIPEPTTEDLFEVVKDVEQQLGRADKQAADYTLRLSVARSKSSLGATATGSATRVQWTGRLTYGLTNIETAETIQTATITQFTGYSPSGNIATSLSAERAAERRLLDILAKELVDQLLLIDPALLS